MIQVWYHRNCADGLGAAWAAWHGLSLSEEAKLVAVQYGDLLPAVSNEDTIYMVDFSLAGEDLHYLLGNVQHVTIIDHHQTAVEKLEGIEARNLTLLLDVSQSGAKLTWDFFYPTASDVCPAAILDIQDRDLWKFERSTSKAFHEVLLLETALEQEKFFRFMDRITCSPVAYDKAVGLGNLLLKALDARVAKAAKSAVLHEVRVDNDLNELFMWHDIPVVNAVQDIDDLGNYLNATLGCQFSVSFFILPASFDIVLSFRSGPDGENVRKIAELLGGGGHDHAAGAKVSYSTFINCFYPQEESDG